MPIDYAWTDRFGDRAYEMLRSRAWGSFGWALAGGAIGALIGALPTGLPFLTWVVGCAGIAFIAWFAVGLVLGTLAMAGWVVELVGLAAGRVRLRRRTRTP